MDESMTSHPTVIEPGRAGRGGGGWVIHGPEAKRLGVKRPGAK